MKILLVSGATKKDGATARAVFEAERVLKDNNISYDVFNLSTSAITTCSGCGWCRSGNRCIHEDAATMLADICGEYDGYIFFTPVHYGGATGAMKAALSRVFYSKKASVAGKPAAAVAVSRRAGNITAIEEITRFFLFASMPTVAGAYPGVVRGTTREAVENDSEGLQNVKSICENMIRLLRCIEIGKSVGKY